MNAGVERLLRAIFSKNQAVLDNFDSLKFCFPPFLDISFVPLSGANSQNIRSQKSIMADLQQIEVLAIF